LVLGLEAGQSLKVCYEAKIDIVAFWSIFKNWSAGFGQNSLRNKLIWSVGAL